MNSRIRVSLGKRSYPIRVERGLLSCCASDLRRATRAQNIVILSTARIYRWYGERLRREAARVVEKVTVCLIPDGEAQKNEKTLFHILEFMARAGLQRDGALVVLGGGVLGDLGGLAASLYMRGIDLVQCPTTLLAQVDASVGGKTAVDLAGVKNLVGTFYQPRAVLIDPTTCATLPPRQLRNGLSEVIKHGVIRDAKLFSFLEKNMEKLLRAEPRALGRCIHDSCRIKSAVVSKDEREGGLRAILNYGHTVGHALEAYYQYRVLSHGEAVAWGMAAAARLSRKWGLCGPEVVERQEKLLQQAGLLKPLPHFQPDRVFAKMLLDKKVRHGRVQFVLTRKIGVVTIMPNVPKNAIFWALNQLQAVPHGQ